MTIARLPHPVYASFWLARYVVMVTAMVFGWFAALFTAVALFVPAEALALYQRTPYRDQLSEIWTWVLRKLGPESTPLGWNLLAPIAAALEMAALHVLLARTGWIPDLWIWLVTVPCWVLLWLHWWRPGGIGSWWPRT